MSSVSWRQAGSLAIALGLMGACASLPEISRTQAVRDIKVDLNLAPEDLTVAPGDEVRWVNMRTEAILVQIPNLSKEALTCETGFDSGHGGMLESVKVQPNETASLCFKRDAEVLYNVRVQTAVGGGDLVLPGVVRVVADDET